MSESGVAIPNGAARKGLTQKVAFEQRREGGREPWGFLEGEGCCKAREAEARLGVLELLRAWRRWDRTARKQSWIVRGVGAPREACSFPSE